MLSQCVHERPKLVWSCSSKALFLSLVCFAIFIIEALAFVNEQMMDGCPDESILWISSIIAGWQ